MKLMVYSHDAFGLGNIRRMLAICQYLLRVFPEVSILVVSGSPALHSLRLPAGLDYIKLPCLERNETGDIAVKYLGTQVEDAVKLRSDLILTITMNFKPDLVLVDKKPNGLEGELTQTLNFLNTHLPQTRLVLLLRDILDHPTATIAQWQRNNYYETLATFYDQIWIVGMPEVFDVCSEYQFSGAIAQKVRYCGYIRREADSRSRLEKRRDLKLQPDDAIVLVTPGGGADGYRLVETYLSGLQGLPDRSQVRSIIISGPEMPLIQRELLRDQIVHCPNVQLLEFTDDLMSYMAAADVVVSMGGYNTVGELLSLQKRAIVIPRIKPVLEQQIRAERMAKMGLFQTIHPNELTPQRLMNVLHQELGASDQPVSGIARLNMNALPTIAKLTTALLEGDRTLSATQKQPQKIQADSPSETILASSVCIPALEPC